MSAHFEFFWTPMRKRRQALPDRQTYRASESDVVDEVFGIGIGPFIAVYLGENGRHRANDLKQPKTRQVSMPSTIHGVAMVFGAHIVYISVGEQTGATSDDGK